MNQPDPPFSQKRSPLPHILLSILAIAMVIGLHLVVQRAELRRRVYGNPNAYTSMTLPETEPVTTAAAEPTPEEEPTPTPEPTPSPTPEVAAISLDYPYMLEVNKAAQLITVYTLDSHGNYTVPVRYMICSTGASTPEGLWEIKSQYRWRLMSNGGYVQYASRITGSILFQSMTYSTTDIQTLLSVDEYNTLGSPISSACVALQAADAYWIYENAQPGTLVRIVPGTQEDVQATWQIVQFLLPDALASDMTHDPTDPELENAVQVKGYAIMNTPYPGVTPAPREEALSPELEMVAQPAKFAATHTSLPTVSPQETEPAASPTIAEVDE